MTCPWFDCYDLSTEHHNPVPSMFTSTANQNANVSLTLKFDYKCQHQRDHMPARAAAEVAPELWTRKHRGLLSPFYGKCVRGLVEHVLAAATAHKLGYESSSNMHPKRHHALSHRIRRQGGYTGFDVYFAQTIHQLQGTNVSVFSLCLASKAIFPV